MRNHKNGWLKGVVLGCALLVCLPLGVAQEAKQQGSPKLPPIHLDGTYFTANGNGFVPVGAHWVPAKAAMQWNVEWDPKDIEADFAKMHELGYTVTRFDVMWPGPARLDEIRAESSLDQRPLAQRP